MPTESLLPRTVRILRTMSEIFRIRRTTNTAGICEGCLFFRMRELDREKGLESIRHGLGVLEKRAPPLAGGGFAESLHSSDG